MGKLTIAGELNLNSYLTAATTFYISSGADCSTIFRTNTTERMRINPSGCLNINSTQTSADYKLYVGGASRFGGHMNPTTANSYYNGTAALPWYQTVARRMYLYDGTNTTYDYGRLIINAQGTTSTQGYATLYLGNAGGAKTAGGAYGILQLYSTSTGYAQLLASSGTTTTTTHYLPTTGGTLLNTATYSSYALPLAGGTMTGNISFKTTNHTSTPLRVLDDSTDYGHTLIIGAGGTTYVGAGESATSLQSALGLSSTENLYLCADSNIYLMPGCNTISDRKTSIVLESSGAISLNYNTYLAAGKCLYMVYNGSNYAAVQNHNNGNISINAAGKGLYLGYSNTENIYCRGSYVNIDSGNYTSYTVTKTGSGASGTWGISISGNAATASAVAWANVSGKPSSYTPSAHTDHATLKITSTSSAQHLQFSRADLNYVTCPASGYLGVSVNGNGTTLAACELVISDGSIYPGTTNVTTLGTSSKLWSTIHTNRIIAYTTQDADAGTANGVALITGAPSGTHIEMDGNEIIAKTSGTAAGTLYIQSGSGNTEISSGGQTTIGGRVVIKASGDPTVSIPGRVDMGCLLLTNNSWTGYGTGDPSGNLTAVEGRVYFKIIG